jgi:hypothetical protein
MMRISLKKSLANAVAIMTVAAFVFGFAPIRTANADMMPAVSIWIDPQVVNITTATYHVGDKFNATLWVNTYQNTNNSAVFTWQMTVNFNASLLSVTRVGYTNGSTSAFFSGHTTIPVTPIITSTSASTGESLMGTDTRPPGNGSLCWVEMEILQEPTGNETITTTLDINNIDTFLLNGDLNEITPTKYNGQYYYVVPEFTVIILVAMMAVLAVAMIVYRKKLVRLP